MTANRFLLALACDAPREVLERTWADAAETVGVAAILEDAARARLLAALARFVAVCPERAGAATRQMVTVGLVAEARARSCLALLRDLARETGLEALAIKGAGLTLAGVYTGEREFSDVDLLIWEEELPAWRDAAGRVGAQVEPCVEAHELAYVSRQGAMVELHAALPAAVGKDRGSRYAEVRLRAGSPVEGYAGVRPVTGRAAREIAVHHFVFHHGGDPLHAFRALQDLAHVPDTVGGGLAWGAHPPDAAMDRLLDLVSCVRSGSFDGRVAEFLLRLDAVKALRTSPDSEFADVIDRWLALRKVAGEGRAAFVMRRLFPAGLPARERVARPFRLAARYISGTARRSRRATRSIMEWRRFLDGT